MQFDTDVLIHIDRGVVGAGRVFDEAEERRISAVAWMEFMAGAKNREHLSRIQALPRRLGLEIIPVDQAISHRAMALMEDHVLGDGLQTADALIAATALAYSEPLCTGNVKHFRVVRGLKLKAFKL